MKEESQESQSVEPPPAQEGMPQGAKIMVAITALLVLVPLVSLAIKLFM